MRAATILCTAVLAGSLAAATATPAAQDYSPRATMSGVGPIRIGMDERQLEDVLRTRLPETQDASEDACRYIEAGPRWPGTAIMLLDGRVARIDVTKRGIETLSGAAVGDLDSKVMGMYGRRLRITDNDFGAGDSKYLTMFSSDRHFGIRFETDGERITEYYVGTSEAVQFIEGCL